MRAAGCERSQRRTKNARGSTRRGRGWGGRWSLGGRGVDHQDEALLGRWELGNVVFGVGTADMLLHGAISLFLRQQSLVSHLCFHLRVDGSHVEARAAEARRGSDTHADAAFSAAGAIVVLQRADDLVVGVRDREGAGEA